MDKPMSMSVKEYVCRLMSIKMNIPLKTIETIVDHQFQSANEALKTNFSIEISGFGKLLFRHKHAQKMWKNSLYKINLFNSIILDPNTTEQKRISAQNKLDNTIKWMDQIKPKIDSDEHKAVLRGMEKQVDSPSKDERSDRAGLSGENGDMQRMSSVLGE